MVESLFHGAVAALGGTRDAASRAAYAALEAAYRGRPYHSLRHIEAALETFLFIEDDLDPQDSARVVLALAYHDAVYDPKASDNEARSAALAHAALAPLGLEDADLAIVGRLILATRDHRPSDALEGLVVDADLAILAAPAPAYDAYAAAIRQEYAHVPDDAYREGRRRVLQGLLARPLFASPLLDEAAARANLERELAALET
jgi:predicted metal-dependent HD superfamily phosphohydrolase